MSTIKKNTLVNVLQFFNLSAGLRWWGRGLLLWLPDELRRKLIPSRPRLVLAASGEQLIVSEERGAQREELARYPLELLEQGRLQLPRPQNREVVLRLEPGRVLSKTASMPIAAEQNLHEVVGFEIDRLTPFTPDKLYYDARVLTRQPAERTIKVQFTAVLRDWLDARLRELNRAGISPEVVDVSGGGAINLLPISLKPRRSGVARGLSALLWVLVLTTGAAAALLPIWQQREQIVGLMPKLGDAQRRAEVTLALRTQLEDAVESSQFLLQKRQNQVPVIELMNELTKLLPDNTWVEQLIIKDNEVQIRGQSRDATALIGIVEASPYFIQATFRSPVTPDRRTGADRFFLTAQIAQAAAGLARGAEISAADPL